MLKTLSENSVCSLSSGEDDEETLRSRLFNLSRSSMESDGVINTQRKSSTFSLFIENGEPKNSFDDEEELKDSFDVKGGVMANDHIKSGSDKMYQTYAEYYLKTRRSGSLAVPYNDYTSKQKTELEKVFDLFDLDNDEHLNQSDLQEVLEAIDPKIADKSNLDLMIADATQSENSKINFDQFHDYFGGTYYGRFSRFELRYAFELLDKDKDSYIGYDDLALMFDPLDWTQKKGVHIKKILEKMDFNNDGRVCFQDFKSMMNNYK